MNFKQLFVSAKKEFFGLDIGSSSVKIIQLHRNDKGYEVTAAARIEIEHSKEEDSRERRANVIAAIRKCFRHTRVKTKYAVCGVSGPDVAIRSFEIPSPPDGQLEDALVSEAGQVCPFDLDYSIVDYQLISSGPAKPAIQASQAQVLASNEKTSGILVAATVEVIRKKLHLVKNAALKCVLIDVDGLALLNCFLELEELQPGQAVAILNIGELFTNLVVHKDSALPVIRDIPYASKTIIDEFSVEQSISRTYAHNILYSTQDTEQQSNGIRESLGNACEKLIIDIAETLRYYTVQYNTVIDKVLVCGGFAQTRGLIDLLNTELPTNVMLWNPLHKVEIDAAVPDSESIRENGPSMAVAAGLAMRNI